MLSGWLIWRLTAQSTLLRSCWAGQLANHTFPGQALSSKRLTSTCAHPFVRNWLPFLNQRKGQNDRSKYIYFIISLHKRMLSDPAAIESATSWSPVGRASDCATEAESVIWTYVINCTITQSLNILRFRGYLISFKTLEGCLTNMTPYFL